jgi:hypothetical protein
MKLSAALDTSRSKTAVCVVNSRDGSVVFETSVATDPAVIFGALAPFLPCLDRVGHEAGSVSPWLHRELARHRERDPPVNEGLWIDGGTAGATDLV